MVTACFVTLTCILFSVDPCLVNVNRVHHVYYHINHTRVDDTPVKESVEEVTKKFKQECGR